MKNDSTSSLHRRAFVKLSALAAGAGFLPITAGAQETQAAPTLPKLAFAYGALEPHIDAKTMEVHHGKHHAAYVKGFNEALAKLPEFAGKSTAAVLAALPSIKDEAVRTAVRNNGGGHWNHTMFWETLAPAAESGEPSGDLKKAIGEAFGSMEDFQKKFGEAAAKRFGSGWAWLIVQDGKLKIVSTPNQDNPLMKGTVPDAELGTPVLGLDVWEHAYYLNYQNKRPDYVAAWWKVIRWADVSKRFAEAAKMD